MRETEAVVYWIRTEYKVDAVVFRDRPFGKRMAARRKYLSTQMEEDWVDGK